MQAEHHTSIIRETALGYMTKQGGEVVQLRKQLEEARRLLQQVEKRLQQAEQGTVAPPHYVLDTVTGVGALGDDLRDGKTGRLDAGKIAELFSIPMAAIAKGAGIENRQTLQQNPTTKKVQPLLELFERVARLRVNAQFQKPANLRKWFRKPLPVFGGHSAEELFQAGRLQLVAERVDQLLTGDFAG